MTTAAHGGPLNLVPRSSEQLSKDVLGPIYLNRWYGKAEFAHCIALLARRQRWPFLPVWRRLYLSRDLLQDSREPHCGAGEGVEQVQGFGLFP